METRQSTHPIALAAEVMATAMLIATAVVLLNHALRRPGVDLSRKSDWAYPPARTEQHADKDNSAAEQPDR